MDLKHLDQIVIESRNICHKQDYKLETRIQTEKPDRI